MDADARALLELLKPAVERAEQVEARQEALLQKQAESAAAFTAQIDEATRAAEAERARLLEARNNFDALRAVEEARVRNEMDSIITAARADEEEARARIEVLQREQAQSEAVHAAKMAQAERERAEAEAAYLERLRKCEADATAQRAQLQAQSQESVAKREADAQMQIAELQAQSEESVAERERRFEAECAKKRARLQSLESKEAEVQARLAEMGRLVAADGPDAFVQLNVG